MRTILVADDSRCVAEGLSSLFDPLDYRVLYAPNGKAALTLVPAARPALVIADVMLRVMTGIEFVRELRRDPGLGQIPVILWSAVYQPRDIRGFAYGCEPFTAWNKFDDLDGLVSVVNELLGRGRTPQA
jgi:two-component system, sensor histidine kinase and response regulator